jgi:hypothetical protein
MVVAFSFSVMALPAGADSVQIENRVGAGIPEPPPMSGGGGGAPLT